MLRVQWTAGSIYIGVHGGEKTSLMFCVVFLMFAANNCVAKTVRYFSTSSDFQMGAWCHWSQCSHTRRSANVTHAIPFCRPISITCTCMYCNAIPVLRWCDLLGVDFWTWERVPTPTSVFVVVLGVLVVIRFSKYWCFFIPQLIVINLSTAWWQLSKFLHGVGFLS